MRVVNHKLPSLFGNRTKSDFCVRCAILYYMQTRCTNTKTSVGTVRECSEKICSKGAEPQNVTHKTDQASGARAEV